MAIAIRGTPTTATAVNGANVTITLPTGMQENDVVYVIASCTVNSGLTEIGGPTWTQLLSIDNSGAAPLRAAIFRKIMGAVPDVSLSIQVLGNVDDAAAAIAVAFSGVNPSTPEDATTTSATGNSTNPDPPNITSITGGAILLAAAASRANDSAVSPPTAYTAIANTLASDNVDKTSAAMAYRLSVNPGVETPGPFQSWATGRWIAFSIMLRPYLAKPTSFGVMVG